MPQDEKNKRAPLYAPEDHALAEGIGAGGGVVAGAALGASLGPLGAVTGAVLGGVFGTIAGRGIAQATEPAGEEAYWKEHYVTETYYESGYSFEDYAPAYRLGWKHFTPGVPFETAETVMIEEWAQERGASKLDWLKARDAAKAGWGRAAVHSQQ